MLYDRSIVMKYDKIAGVSGIPAILQLGIK